MSTQRNGKWTPGFTGFFDSVLDVMERARERRMLCGMEDRLLRDIGLSRADVDAECRKRWWRR